MMVCNLMYCSEVGLFGMILWRLYTEERLTAVVFKRRSGRANMLGAIGRRYKFFWHGCNKGTTGVCVFIAERWIDSVVDVRIMNVKLVIGKQIVNIVSAYAPQVMCVMYARYNGGIVVMDVIWRRLCVNMI